MVFLLNVQTQLSAESLQKKEASSPYSFSMPSSAMPLIKQLDFHVGKSFFQNPWVIAPSSTTSRDGLGPLYNATSCDSCHIRNGRGHAPEPTNVNQVSYLIRLSLRQHSALAPPSKTPNLPDPQYGGQLQDFAIPGVNAEGQPAVNYSLTTKTFSDGSTIELRKPTVTIEKLAYGPLNENTVLSARVAPALIGLGLLQAIEQSQLLALEDIDDHDGDGVSGKANRIWNNKRQHYEIGRFGWKAGQSHLERQNAIALSNDMGLSSSLFPLQSCTANQQACNKSAEATHAEVSDKILQYITYYVANLQVPSTRLTDSDLHQRGAKLFTKAECNKCHVKSYTTATSEFTWLSNQTIYPYTDLLLHDMGAGLADELPEFSALGTEWRTPPLWGIGLTKSVAGKANFLHDGRARSLMEAILWHGGEAERSSAAVLGMKKSDREALIAFLEAL